MSYNVTLAVYPSGTLQSQQLVVGPSFFGGQSGDGYIFAQLQQGPICPVHVHIVFSFFHLLDLGIRIAQRFIPASGGTPDTNCLQGSTNYTLYVQGSGPRFSGILATAPAGFPCTPFNTALTTLVSTMSFPTPTPGSGSLGRLYTSLLNTTQSVNASLVITRTLLQGQVAASQSTLNTSIQQLSAGLNTAQSVSSANSQAVQTLSNSLNTQVGWSWVNGKACGMYYILVAIDALGARICFM